MNCALLNMFQKIVGREKVPWVWETFQEQVIYMSKGTWDKRTLLVSGRARHTEFSKGSGEQRARKKYSWPKEFLRSVSCHLAVLLTYCSILVFQQAINYVHHTDFPLSVPHLTFCTISPSSAITDKAAEFSTYYLVNKVFPSVLPLCNQSL